MARFPSIIVENARRGNDLWRNTQKLTTKTLTTTSIWVYRKLMEMPRKFPRDVRETSGNVLGEFLQKKSHLNPFGGGIPPDTRSSRWGLAPSLRGDSLWSKELFDCFFSQESSWIFREKALELSQKLPGMFTENSWKLPGTFPEISRKNLGNFPESSRN